MVSVVCGPLFPEKSLICLAYLRDLNLKVIDSQVSEILILSFNFYSQAVW